MTHFEDIINRLVSFGLFTDSEAQAAKEHFLQHDRLLSRQGKPTEYMQLIENFNSLTGKKFSGDHESRALFYEAALAPEEYTKAIGKMAQNDFIKQKDWLLNPTYLIQNYERFQNDKSASKPNNTTSTDGSQDHGKAIELA